MSQENVEAFKRAWTRGTRGDFEADASSRLTLELERHLVAGERWLGGRPATVIRGRDGVPRSVPRLASMRSLSSDLEISEDPRTSMTESWRSARRARAWQQGAGARDRVAAYGLSWSS